MAVFIQIPPTKIYLGQLDLNFLNCINESNPSVFRADIWKLMGQSELWSIKIKSLFEQPVPPNHLRSLFSFSHPSTKSLQ